MPSTGSAVLSAFGGSESAERKYMGCDLQAKLAGYRSQTVPLAGRRAMDNPDVGTILLHRNGPAEEGKTISAVSLAAPKDAKKAYEKGLDAIKKKKFDDAQRSFEKAVEVYPKYSTAWYELGMLQAGQGKMDMARKYFDTALEHDPKFVKPYLSDCDSGIAGAEVAEAGGRDGQAGEAGSVRLSAGVLLQLGGQLQFAEF